METIRVPHPNQKMFLEAFQTCLRVRHFNESLAQKPATFMEDITTKADCYIHGEERNAKKNTRYAIDKGSPPRFEGVRLKNIRRNYMGEKSHLAQERLDRKPLENWTPLNANWEKILQETYTARVILEVDPLKGDVMGANSGSWCKYH